MKFCLRQFLAISCHYLAKCLLLSSNRLLPTLSSSFPNANSSLSAINVNAPPLLLKLKRPHLDVIATFALWALERNLTTVLVAESVINCLFAHLIISTAFIVLALDVHARSALTSGIGRVYGACRAREVANNLVRGDP